MSNYSFQRLDNPTNLGMGVGEIVYVAPKSWFTTIQVPTAPFLLPGDQITIKTAHVLAAGRTGWIPMQLAPQKNKLDAPIIGDIGTQKQNQEVELFYPGNTPADHEAMQNLLNTPLLVLVPDANCKSGYYYQLGCDCQSAWLSPTFGTGTTKDGTKGFTCKVMYDGAVQFYQTGTDPVVMTNTLPTLAAPVLTPSAVTATTVIVGWQAVANATQYSYDISTSPTFGTTVAGQSGNTNAITKTFSTLTTGTTYYVRVKATDSTGTYLASAYTIIPVVTA